MRVLLASMQKRVFSALLAHLELVAFILCFVAVTVLQRLKFAFDGYPVQAAEFALHTVVLTLGVYNIVWKYLGFALIRDVAWSAAWRRGLQHSLNLFGSTVLLSYPIGRGVFGPLPPASEPYLILLFIYVCLGLLAVLFAWTASFDALWHSLCVLAWLFPSWAPRLHTTGVLHAQQRYGRTSAAERGDDLDEVADGRGVRVLGPHRRRNAASKATEEQERAGLALSDADDGASGARRPVWTSAAPLLLSLLCLCVGIYNASLDPVVVHVTIPLARLHPDLDGFTLAQLSDVHVGPTVGGKRLGRLVDIVNSLQPDAVVLTGDFFDGHHDTYRAGLDPLKRLRVREQTSGKAQAPSGLHARPPVFFCSGNHEYYDGHFPTKLAILRALGVTILQNERVTVPLSGQSYTPRAQHAHAQSMDAAAAGLREAGRGAVPPMERGRRAGRELRSVGSDGSGSAKTEMVQERSGGERDEATFDLAGVPDWSASPLAGRHHASNISAAFIGRDPLRELVLCAHQPKHIFEAGAMGVGLQISGHVHGGQIAPYQIPVFMGNPYFAGLYTHYTPARDGVGKDGRPGASGTGLGSMVLAVRAMLGMQSGPVGGPGDAYGSLDNERWLTWIYVSRGSVFWGPPVRLGSQHEVTLITLRALRSKRSTGSDDGEWGPRTVVYPASLAARMHA